MSPSTPRMPSQALSHQCTCGVSGDQEVKKGCRVCGEEQNYTTLSLHFTFTPSPSHDVGGEYSNEALSSGHKVPLPPICIPLPLCHICPAIPFLSPASCLSSSLSSFPCSTVLAVHRIGPVTPQPLPPFFPYLNPTNSVFLLGPLLPMIYLSFHRSFG